MPKGTKLKSTENAVTTVVDRTKKRKASSSPEKKAKKTSKDNEENHEVKPSMTMNFQTSDRLSCRGEKCNLKIVSWNINGIRAWLTNGGLKYLEREQADIICFQELKCDREKIPVDATPTGYKSFWLPGDQGKCPKEEKFIKKWMPFSGIFRRGFIKQSRADCSDIWNQSC